MSTVLRLCIGSSTRRPLGHDSEHNQATYIAMETGHPDKNALLAKSIAALIAAGAPT